MAIVPRLFQHFKDFGVRYCAGHLNHFGWDFKGASNLEELQTVMSIFMIRRRKAEVLAHLPPKSREHLMLAVSATSHTTTRPRLKVGIVEDEDAQPVDSSTLSFWRETSAIKMPAVVAYIRQLVASKGEPFLLFAHHREMLDALDELLYQLRVDFIRIDGQVDSALRQQHCNRFQTDPFCRVALLSVTAAGVGLTLTRASLVVFAELYWNPGLLMQAEDRVHRIGQTQPVTIRYLLAKNTIDDVIWYDILFSAADFPCNIE
jgi:SWI/SNF-related matrix-associated actin-dependent regulator 1 of chromatin subfamily A